MKLGNLRTKAHSLTAILACALFCGAIHLFAQTNKITSTNSAASQESVYRAFAEKVELSMRAGNPKVLANAIDADALLDRALNGLSGSEQTRNGFRKGFKEDFVPSLTKSWGELTDYKLLRLIVTNGQYRAVFRALPEGGGFNYHTLVLKARPGGVKIVDLEFAITGEPISATVRRLALPLFAQSEKGFLEKLVGTEHDLIKYQDQWVGLVTASQQNDSQKVLSLYDKLPLSLQREKFILVHRLKAAQNVSDDEYQKAINFWITSLPEDPSLAVISIDYYAFKKQYAKVITAIDKLEKIVGGDPYLQFLRANQYYALDQTEKARTEVDAALKAEPTLAPAYDLALMLSVERKDFKETGRLIIEAEKNLKISLVETVDGADDYKDFRETDVYRNWKKTHAAETLKK